MHRRIRNGETTSEIEERERERERERDGDVDEKKPADESSVL